MNVHPEECGNQWYENIFGLKMINEFVVGGLRMGYKSEAIFIQDQRKIIKFVLVVLR